MRRKMIEFISIFLSLTLIYSAVFILKSELRENITSHMDSTTPTYTNYNKKRSTLTKVIDLIKSLEYATVTKIDMGDGNDKYFEIELLYEGTISSLREIIIVISRECSLISVDRIDMQMYGNSIKHTVRMTFSH